MLSHILITVMPLVHGAAPCSAHALTQAHPTRSYIPLVLKLLVCMHVCVCKWRSVEAGIHNDV